MAYVSQKYISDPQKFMTLLTECSNNSCFLTWVCCNSDTSVVPPLIYALMGSSREIAIGPVAVVSLLLSSMIQKIEDPIANPIAYRKLVFTVTFFAGAFQAVFGLFRCSSLLNCFIFLLFFEVLNIISSSIKEFILLCAD